MDLIENRPSPTQSSQPCWVLYQAANPIYHAGEYHLVHTYDSEAIALEGARLLIRELKSNNPQWDANVYEDAVRRIFWVTDSMHVSKMRYVVFEVSEPAPLVLHVPQEPMRRREKEGSSAEQNTSVKSGDKTRGTTTARGDHEFAQQSPSGLVQENGTLSSEDSLPTTQEYGVFSSEQLRDHTTSASDDSALPYESYRASTNEGINAIDTQSTENSHYNPEIFSHDDDNEEIDDNADESGDEEEKPKTANQTESSPNSTPGPSSSSQATPGSDAHLSHYGLYIIKPNPLPNESSAYCIQVNTSLGQAETDMKQIASVQLDSAAASEGLSLVLAENKIEIVNNVEGTRLGYEIHRGRFVEGRFVSEMEMSGRAVVGESYAREKMKGGIAVEDGHGHAEKEASSAEEGKEFPCKRARNEDGDVDLEYGSQGNISVRQGLAAPPAKKAKIEIDESDEGEASTVDTVKGEPETGFSSYKAISDGSADQNNADDSALCAPSPNQPRSNSPADIEGEQDGELDDSEAFREHSPPKSTASSENAKDGEYTEINNSTHEKDMELNDIVQDEDLHPSNDASRSHPRSPSTIISKADTHPAPFDVYCRCQKPDDGSMMIGCDGSACPNNGWVHPGCVGLKAAPPGGDDETWFCPDCAPARVAGGRRAANRGRGGKVGAKRWGRRGGGEEVGAKRWRIR